MAGLANIIGWGIYFFGAVAKEMKTREALRIVRA
jgi:hypothetical protein